MEPGPPDWFEPGPQPGNSEPLRTLQISMRYSHDSLHVSNTWLHRQCCNEEFVSILAYNNRQNFIYRQQWTHRTCNTPNARPKIVHPLLTLIFNIGQGACRVLFRLSRGPLLWFCLAMTKSLFNHLTYMTKNHWSFVDTHFENGAGSALLSLLPIKAANTSFMNVHNQLPFQLPRMQDQEW